MGAVRQRFWSLTLRSTGLFQLRTLPIGHKDISRSDTGLIGHSPERTQYAEGLGRAKPPEWESRTKPPGRGIGGRSPPHYRENRKPLL